MQHAHAVLLLLWLACAVAAAGVEPAWRRLRPAGGVAERGDVADGQRGDDDVRGGALAGGSALREADEPSSVLLEERGGFRHLCYTEVEEEGKATPTPKPDAFGHTLERKRLRVEECPKLGLLTAPKVHGLGDKKYVRLWEPEGQTWDRSRPNPLDIRRRDIDVWTLSADSSKGLLQRVRDMCKGAVVYDTVERCLGWEIPEDDDATSLRMVTVKMLRGDVFSVEPLSNMLTAAFTSREKILERLLRLVEGGARAGFSHSNLRLDQMLSVTYSELHFGFRGEVYRRESNRAEVKVQNAHYAYQPRKFKQTGQEKEALPDPWRVVEVNEREADGSDGRLAIWNDDSRAVAKIALDIVCGGSQWRSTAEEDNELVAAAPFSLVSLLNSERCKKDAVSRWAMHEWLIVVGELGRGRLAGPLNPEIMGGGAEGRDLWWENRLPRQLQFPTTLIACLPEDNGVWHEYSESKLEEAGKNYVWARQNGRRCKRLKCLSDGGSDCGTIEDIAKAEEEDEEKAHRPAKHVPTPPSAPSAGTNPRARQHSEPHELGSAAAGAGLNAARAAKRDA